MDFIEFRTPRFLLRQIRPEDLDQLFSYWSDEEVTRYLSLRFYRRDEAAAMIEMLNRLPLEDTGMRWAIVDDQGQVLGTCGFHKLDHEHRRAEIGYEIGTAYWGHGVIQEVLPAVLEFCFHTLNLNRLEAFVTIGNNRSLRTLKRLGFTDEGILREYEFALGQFQSYHMLSILQREWKARNMG
ncbi:MAG: GNAT family N-acetyltransferase [Methylocystaceae bacterium]